MRSAARRRRSRRRPSVRTPWPRKAGLSSDRYRRCCHSGRASGRLRSPQRPRRGPVRSAAAAALSTVYGPSTAGSSGKRRHSAEPGSGSGSVGTQPGKLKSPAVSVSIAWECWSTTTTCSSMVSTLPLSVGVPTTLVVKTPPAACVLRTSSTSSGVVSFERIVVLAVWVWNVSSETSTEPDPGARLRDRGNSAHRSSCRSPNSFRPCPRPPPRRPPVRRIRRRRSS